MDGAIRAQHPGSKDSGESSLSSIIEWKTWIATLYQLLEFHMGSASSQSGRFLVVSQAVFDSTKTKSRAKGRKAVPSQRFHFTHNLIAFYCN